MPPVSVCPVRESYQNVVGFDETFPLLLEVFEQQIAVPLIVKRSPVDMVEVRGVGLAPGRRHDPQTAAFFTDVGGFTNETADIRGLSRSQILVDEVDDPGDLLAGPHDVEGIQCGCIQIEVHREDTIALVGQFDRCVDQSRGAADAALERIEGRNVHEVKQPAAVENDPGPCGCRQRLPASETDFRPRPNPLSGTVSSPTISFRCCMIPGKASSRRYLS